jgi:hypothetical protein
MDPIALFVLFIWLILVLVAAIVPGMQRKRAEKAELAEEKA